jgi:hypothetical protein
MASPESLDRAIGLPSRFEQVVNPPPRILAT